MSTSTDTSTTSTGTSPRVPRATHDPRRNILREGMIIGEALDVVVEGVEARRRQDTLRTNRQASVSGRPGRG